MLYLYSELTMTLIVLLMPLSHHNSTSAMVLSSRPGEDTVGIVCGCCAVGFAVSKGPGEGVGCSTCIVNVKMVLK